MTMEKCKECCYTFKSIIFVDEWTGQSQIQILCTNYSHINLALQYIYLFRGAPSILYLKNAEATTVSSYLE